MRYKVIPEPRSQEALLEARDALPLVPGSVEDCCTRIRDRTPVRSRDAARELLTFMQALGLARETDRGYHRVREDKSAETLATNFRANVFGAEEALSALADAGEPLTPAEVFESVRDIVPRWERSKHADWEAEWRERVERLLAWGVEFGTVEQVDGRYTLTGG